MFRHSWLSGLLFAATAVAQYNILYYPPGGTGFDCRTRPIGCRNAGQYDCCEAPPGRENFRRVQVTSSGPPGVVIFHATDASGTCLGCATSGSINVCYVNDPFETVTVFNPDQSTVMCTSNLNDIPSKRDVEGAPTARTPPTNEDKQDATSMKPTVCRKPNVTVIGGEYYRVPAKMDDQFIHDLTHMGDSELIQKYQLAKDVDGADGAGDCRA